MPLPSVGAGVIQRMLGVLQEDPEQKYTYSILLILLLNLEYL